MLKKLLGALRALTSVPSDNPRLLQAQYIALSRQLPLMYFVLLVNTWARPCPPIILGCCKLNISHCPDNCR
ncbi:hypothetical protein AO277_00285 [Pseudomonas amygdali]|nr:hypothetical protein AO277_00285 [Pseudomonas amygdali]